MQDGWYVRDQDASRPVDTQELERLAAAGLIGEDAWVWAPGWPEWRPYRDAGLRPACDAQALDGLGRRHPPPPLQVFDDGWQAPGPAPWRRYFARMLDTVLLAVGGWFAIGLVVAALQPDWHVALFGSYWVTTPLLSGMLSCLLVAPVLALPLGLLGSSPGKWLFGVRVTRLDGTPIGVRAALRREFDVFVWGVGAGVPLLTMLASIASFIRLTSTGSCRWDAQRPWCVTHRRNGAQQWVLGTIGVLAFATLAAWGRR